MTKQPLFDLPFLKIKNFLSTNFSTVLSQQTNTKHRKEVIEICFPLLDYKLTQFLDLWKNKIAGGKYETKMCQFIFTESKKISSLQIFKDELTGEIEQNEAVIKDVIDTMNHYYGISLIMDLLKNIVDF
jgi:hypothetical protein